MTTAAETVLCCGEALIDMLPCTTATGEPAFAAHPGGAAFNAAVALGRLGMPVEFFCGLSRDPFGRQLGRVLAESGVGTRHAVVSDRPTTLAFVHLEDGEAGYSFHDENTAGRMIGVDDLPDLDERIGPLLFGGISLAAEPCGTAYETLMRRERGRRPLLLDPNVRPAVIADPRAHRDRLQRMIAMADLVKLSEEDLGWFGEAGSEFGIAARWLASGPALVVVTRGGRGATAYGAWGAVAVPARPVAVADTIGAGDTFNAGLIASLRAQGLLARPAMRGLTPKQAEAALGFAARAAAVTVSRAGANPPWRHELAAEA